MEMQKSKAEIIEDLKKFIGSDIPEAVYDAAATAAAEHPGVEWIDFSAYRNAAKVTDNENLAFWIASGQRKKEDILVVNRDPQGNPLLAGAPDWLSVREAADYFMEDMEYVYEVLERGRFDLNSAAISADIKNLLQKREFYQMLSAQNGLIKFRISEEEKELTLAQLSYYLQMPFMELYTRYKEKGQIGDALFDFSESIRKQVDLEVFMNAVEVEEVFLKKEFDLYQVLRFKNSMAKKSILAAVGQNTSYSFKNVDDFYCLFLKNLGEKERHKGYYLDEEVEKIREMEEKVLQGEALEGTLLKQLVDFMEDKQITKKENTRLFCYLAEKRGIWKPEGEK